MKNIFQSSFHFSISFSIQGYSTNMLIQPHTTLLQAISGAKYNAVEKMIEIC